jgi:ABC-type transport system substrate-binding protein
MRDARLAAVACLLVCVGVGCSNNPYPDSDDKERVLYLNYQEAPKTLDPAVAYSTVDHMIVGPVFDTLLQYHFLERPYRLIPGLLAEMPEVTPRDDGRVVFHLKLRDDLLFQDDACFALGTPGATTRPVMAADVAFQLMRLADPKVNSPVAPTMARIAGFEEFAGRLKKLREDDPSFTARRIDEQYATAGGIDGVRVLGPAELEIVLGEAYPQFRFWLAMEFTAPVPWEAVAYYDGRGGREAFAEHPVGTGPFRLALYDKRLRIELARNPNWHGVRHPEAQAPGAVYPGEGESDDAARGWLDPAYVGRPLPFLDRVDFELDKEDIPAFTKFLQGYYDLSGIIEESFDRVVHQGRLSPEMEQLGMQLAKAVQPSIYYMGFNMQDPVVGAPAGDRGRKLRQAMSLVIDSQAFMDIFLNGRGIAAQSVIPPGIFGYEETYLNPFRRVDLDRARALLREAGYPGGIDPETGKPLHLTFDTGDTSARGRLRYQFFVDAWSRIGVDVEIAATTYNQFQDKVRRGAYQLFMWGWVADYPDPENFLFLLWSESARSAGGPNTANFSDPQFDRLFLAMRDAPDGPERLRLIQEMRAILEHERPWVELFHPESYALIHGWVHNAKPLGMSFSTLKYRDVDVALRARQRLEWNRPVTWPAWALLGIAVVVFAPAVRTVVKRLR